MIAALKPILDVVKKVFLSLDSALIDPARLNYFVNRNGWLAEEITTAQITIVRTAIDISDTIADITALIDRIQNGNESMESLFDEVKPLITDAYNIIDDIQNISSTSFSFYPFNQPAFWSEFGQNMFSFLLSDYLKKRSSALYAILRLTDIIEEENIVPSEARRIPYIRYTLNWNDLGTLFSDPQQLFTSAYKWGDPNGLDYNKVLYVINQTLGLLNTPSNKLLISSDNYTRFYENNPNFPNPGLEQININILKNWNIFTNDYKNLQLRIIPLPKDNNAVNISGLGLQLYLNGNYNTKFRFSPEFIASIETKVTLENLLLLKVFPDETELLTDLESAQFTTGIAFAYLPPKPNIIFGTKFGSRLEFYGIEFNFIAIGTIEDPEFIIRLGNGNLITAPILNFTFEPGNSDNFIQKILGNKPFSTGFGGAIRWSSKHGFGFEGNTSFSIEIPLTSDKKNNDSNYPIKLRTLRLAFSFGNSDTRFNVGLDFDLDFSVIKASVRDIGLSFSLEDKTQSSEKGILDSLDFDLSFKPPTGIGLAIDAPPVSGGGFLNYDAAKYTYTGGLELNFSKISFSAIGILTTKLPGGEDGYSLLIIITAEFGPLPLGMGFTLNGLGGLLGLNRTMNPDVLREGIKNNTLDNILFPHDIVENANTIISNIGQAFPIMKDQFIIGPMAKIGWGTPTLITIELGIMIELPNPVRLAILGVIKAILPTEEKAVLQLQVNFLGIIDFDNKYISFDATLYDSRILTFGLFGDMALRIYWGDQPNFLLSVGGFHPKFTPPPLNLPTMNRLTIILANQDSLKISVETYFAITSNSVQFGARVAAMAKAWKIQAIGALYFDILFQFRPFHFIADMGVMFAIKMGSKTLLSIFIDLSLEGPHPWKAQGKGTFKIVLVKVSVSFDKTFGQADVAAIESVAVDPKFLEAVNNNDNWQAILPDRNSRQIAIKEIEPSVTGLVVDPAGRLRFSQNLLPLDTEMEKFGNSAVSDFKQYSITGATAGSTFAINPVQDYFARNSFFNMSDDDKLSRPSYELFNSGIIAGSDQLRSKYAVHKLCDYDDITIDIGYRKKAVIKSELSIALFNVHVFDNYVSHSRLAEFEKIPTEKGPDKIMLDHTADEFILINRNDLSMAYPQGFSSSVEAERILEVNRSSQPAVAAEWIVANRFEL